MQVTEKETYTVFTVLECPDSFDFLEIGPIVTSLNEVVGDVIGVVQGGMAAIGIQALNVKTLSGFPHELKDQVIYRKETPTSELTVSALDFSMAAAYDMPYYLVEKNDRIEEKLKAFLQDERASLMEVVIDPMDLV